MNMEQRCRNYISMQINKIFISSTTQQRRLMEVTHFLKKSAFVLAHGVLQWLWRSFFFLGGGGVRRDNLVSLNQKIKQSNHNVQSEKRRIYKESRRTHSKNNQTVRRAGKRE